ncbi:MAG: TIGR01212 family radical SAM protein [Candidatus Omnitrophota bacterium]
MGRYRSFSGYLKSRFGEKVWRISLDPGFPCPNRESSSSGKCLYCDGEAYSGTLLRGASIREQLAAGIKAAMSRGIKKHIAYFQDSTPTNAAPEEIKKVFDVIREFPSVVALSVSTRPDCIDDEKLDIIAGYLDTYDVWIEYGLQTANNKTLELIERGHTFSETEDAIWKTAERGIKSAVHVILGLPGESREDMLNTAREISRLPVWGIKLHVLHVLKNTGLETLYRQGKLRLFTLDEYAFAVRDFLENVPKDTVILRLVSGAKEENLIAPKWINDKLRALTRIEQVLGT